MQQWIALFLALCYIECRHVSRHVAHTAEVVGPFGDTDGATRVEHIEQVRAFEIIVVGWETSWASRQRLASRS